MLWRQGIILLAWLTIVTGLAYPAFVTVVAWVLWPHEAGGSLLVREGKVVGSTLVGQPFVSGRYFRGRPSATAYQALPSGASNLAPTNRKLAKAVEGRVAALSQEGVEASALPAELLTSSGSGLDGHISVEGALLQIDGLLRERRLDSGRYRPLVEALVRQHTEPPSMGLLGRERVNVLQLNLALDGLRHE